MMRSSTTSARVPGGASTRWWSSSRALERVVLIQHAVSTMLIDVDGDTANVRTVCHCPVVLDRGNGRTEMFFQGLWYVDELVRTADGWKIARRAEQDYFHDIPPDFRFA
jgi:hypothetical protein